MKKIGLFDSGIGGLSVLKQMLNKGIAEEYFYVADTARAPFGTKSHEEIARICIEIIDFLKSLKVDAVVAACNTADASLKLQKIRFDLPYYGITRVDFPRLEKVAIWATEATIKSHVYREIFQAAGTKFVLEMPLQELVKIVEEGSENSTFAIDYLDRAVDTIAKAGISDVVLGCTHFPIIVQKLKERYPMFNFIDPAELLVEKMVESGYQFGHPMRITFYVTGDVEHFEGKLKKRGIFLQIPYTVEKLRSG